MSHVNQSRFAAALQGLFDETRLFSRAEWAEVLGVSQSAISQWIKDKTIPRADNLSMIVLTLEQSSDIPSGPLESFKKVAASPSAQVSPHGKRMLPTVREYMLRPGNSELASELAKLSEIEQEKLLEKRFASRQSNTQAFDVSVADNVGSIAPTYCAPSTTESRKHQIVVLGTWGGNKTWMLPKKRTASKPGTIFLEPTFRIHSEEQPDEPIGPAVGLEQIAQNSVPLMIIGEAGCGKSSFMFHVFQGLEEKSEWAAQAWGDRIPAYVPLHRLPAVQNTNELWDVLNCDIPASSRSQLVLLFDGFDEVSFDRRAGMADAISGLCINSPETAVVVTSRPIRDLRRIRHISRCSLQAPSDSRLLALAYKEASDALIGSHNHWDEAVLQIGTCFRERPDVFHAVRNPLLLSYAARLFARKAIPDCQDVDVLDSCLSWLLVGWDQEKEVNRQKSTWIRSSPRAFSKWFGGLCYRSLIHQESDFSHDHIARWFKEEPERVPDESDLRAASELTGIIQPSQGDRWKFVHHTFQEYLAARYIIEGSYNATDYIVPSLDKPWVSSVLRFACSITNDATPLLRLVLEATAIDRSVQMPMLADMVAQQISASSDVIKECCDSLAGWFEEYFTDWKVATSDDESEVFPEPKWRIAAQNQHHDKTSSGGPGKKVLQAIKAVHRARFSPARKLLANRLASSTNEVVRGLGDSMSVDGYMEGRYFSRDESDLLIAEVCEI